jgi:nicotinamidase/pyrazinamidase
MFRSKPLNDTNVLIVTDVQVDFLEGGALPVPEATQILPIINQYVEMFNRANQEIYFTRDWHPSNHISFKSEGGIWPIHCVQGTHGADFHPDLQLPNDFMVISKATDPKKESYSAFDGTDLERLLKESGVKRFFICGLATEYCVLNTVLDGLKLGFKPVVLVDAIKGINLKPNDSKNALSSMIAKGAEQAFSGDFQEPVEALPLEETSEDALEEKPAARALSKKKARARPRGAVKRIKAEG